jgi:hypothetical protein
LLIYCWIWNLPYPIIGIPLNSIQVGINH